MFKVQGVTVTRTVQDSSPALRVSWSAVSGNGITYQYDVCYGTASGTQSAPPSNANCDTTDITGTSTTLGPLSRGTTYYIWVRAVSLGGKDHTVTGDRALLTMVRVGIELRKPAICLVW